MSLEGEFFSAANDQVVYREELPARRAVLTSEWPTLPTRLLENLPKQPFAHQFDAVNAAQNGKDIVVITGTNSGKSLCFQVPAITSIMQEPMARAMFLYPTKALAQDQLTNLISLSKNLDVRTSTYDGDTPKSHRSSIRNLSHILLTNPDMLHSAILPNHDHWVKFLKSVRVIAIDEMHTYRGIFGSHVALVIRRLLRLCAWYHNRPQIIATSATIGNPDSLFEQLTGRKATLIDADGSPSGKRSVVFFNPAILPNGERLSGNIAASEATAALIEAGQSVLTFNRSRVGAELVLRYTKNRLSDDLLPKIESYRAGYTPKERRQIEKQIQTGKLLGLSATNALELGINIGNLDAVVVNGYPGSIASFWQQIGRAGRGTKDSLAIYIAGDNPLEQYLLQHPETLIEGKSEKVSISPENPNILRAQLNCAAHEKPLSPSELDLFPHGALEMCEEMDRTGELAFRGGNFFYPANDSPSQRVNIRGSVGKNMTLEVGGEELGFMEYNRALTQAHPGAVYLHRGEPFEVQELNLETYRATLAKFEGSYYTQAKIQSLVEPGEPFAIDGYVSLCGVKVTNMVIGYSKKRFDGDTVLDVLPLEMPPVSFDTIAIRFDLPALDLDQPIEPQIGGIHGMEHALLGLAPLFGGCDRNDVGSAWFTVFHETLRPAIFIFDNIPGGVGIAEQLYARVGDWIKAAHHRISFCPCASGCPSCLYLPNCEIGNEQIDKRATIKLLRTTV
jgi:DEAD/DEAH box helicase domain-containing protein